MVCKLHLYIGIPVTYCNQEKREGYSESRGGGGEVERKGEVTVSTGEVIEAQWTLDSDRTQ